MSIYRVPHVYCDGPIDECPLDGHQALDLYKAESNRSINVTLKALGWLVKGNRHYCPTCRKSQILAAH